MKEIEIMFLCFLCFGIFLWDFELASSGHEKIQKDKFHHFMFLYLFTNISGGFKNGTSGHENDKSYKS
jgi:hypothetical protein